MARFVQLLLLPLICAVFAETHLDLPFFDVPGLQHPSHPDPDTKPKQPIAKDINNFDHQSWLHHVMGQRHPSHTDGDVHSFNKHKEDSYENNPFLNRYFGGSDSMEHFDPMSSIIFPGMSNAFNVLHKIVSIPEEQHEKDSNEDITEAKIHSEKLDGILPSDKKPTVQENDPKSSDDVTPSSTKKPEDLQPKTNEMKETDTLEDTVNKNEEVVDLNKNKDYLLVGSGNSDNNVYLLNDRNPITEAVPQANQPVNNVVYTPYYSEQNNKPLSQIVNQQPTNFQVSPNKITVNGYSNGIAAPAQPINTVIQNPGYVLVYSNGQLMQIPGVVLNSAPNNLPLQNSNPIQGTNYIIANTVPNNVVATQNPGTNVIYATLLNQGSNYPIVIQMPQCINDMSNNLCSSGTVFQNPANNAANIVTNNGLVSNAINQPNQNIAAQPAILLTSGFSNGYAQPTTVPQPINTVVSTPTQNTVLSNQNGISQLAIQLPLNSNSIQYNQPIVTSLLPNTAVNTLSQMGVNSQNVQLQPADQIFANANPSGYNTQPIVSIQTPNVGSNQDSPSILVNSASNENNQQIIPNQGDQSTDAVVNASYHDKVANQPEFDIRNVVPSPYLPNNDANSMGLDYNSMASLGAQPAIMISGFKETTDDQNDKNNTKTKTGKKDKSKKKSKKNKDSSESMEEKQLINKKK